MQIHTVLKNSFVSTTCMQSYAKMHRYKIYLNDLYKVTVKMNDNNLNVVVIVIFVFDSEQVMHQDSTWR